MSKSHDRDIKPNIDVISKNIKKEPEFRAREIKREPDFVVKAIKKEPNDFDTKFPSKSKKKKKKRTRTNNSGRKTNAKIKKENSKKQKKSSQTKKAENCKGSVISKKSAKNKRRKMKKKLEKQNRSLESENNFKKEGNTLLDQQNNGRLRLFGFKDELEYFSSESDHEDFKETSSKSDTSGKRTNLSSLSAREKVILTLKSAYLNPFSRPKPVIQPPEVENVDLLGSILESQSLWHSKNSHLKVNEDGRVEVINEGKNLKEIADGQESNQHESEANNIVPTQKRNDPNCTLPTHIEALPCESLNLNENIETHVTKINVNADVYDATDAWDTETVIDEDNEEPHKEDIDVEVNEEIKNLSKSPSTVSSLQMYSPSASEGIFVESANIEKSDGECDDCPIFSVYSKASKTFSTERYEERQGTFSPDQSEIQHIQIKETEKAEVQENILKRHKNCQDEEEDRERETNRSPSPKRKKEENGREVIK